MTLQISATNPEHPALLLELPWHAPLEEWPEKYLVPLPRGISRHVVRYARAGSEVVAVKELAERPAVREYELLRTLDRLAIPAVDPVAVVTGRTDADGSPLEPVLITRHLGGSLPYRSMFETTMRPGTVHRLMDALAVLLVRLHLAGFAWGDCSLSNTLFRRDAGAYAAYLVDAETGELHPGSATGSARTTSSSPGSTSAARCSTSRRPAPCIRPSTRSPSARRSGSATTRSGRS